MMQRVRAIHPILIAPYPVLLLYSRNLHTVDGSEIIGPIALSWLVIMAAWGLLVTLRLDGPRAALIVSAGFVLFFWFGPAVRQVGRLGPGSSLSIRESLVMGVESLTMAGLVVFVLKKPGLARASTRFVNATAAALVVLVSLGIVRQLWPDSRSDTPRPEPRPVVTLPPLREDRPDVYLLVLDAYGRSDALREVIGFDNSAFIDRLEGRGFVVANRATANYCQTALSLSSTLNLRYLDDLAGRLSDDRIPLRRLIADNAVVRTFRSLGYRTVTFDPGFDATESMASDLRLAPERTLRTFPSLVVDQTPLWLLLGSSPSRQSYQRHRERILNVFDHLPVIDHPSVAPTFTIAHVVAPHPPFVFGQKGDDVSDLDLPYSLNDTRAEGPEGSEQYARRYRAQVSYLTKRVEETVERILATSKVEPIIIVQGDHGSGSRFEAGSDRPNHLFERMTVLNAIYLPRAHRGPIDPSISLVNTFRLVFDRCFGGKLGLLPDRNFYSSFPHPYAFIEVTGRIEPAVDE